MIRARNVLLLSFSLLVQASAFASGIGTRGGAPPKPQRFSAEQAKVIVDALAVIAPSETGDWTLNGVKCNKSQMEIVGGPSGPPFSIREIDYCEFNVKGEKQALEQAQAKLLFAALDIDWVRGRTSNMYRELGLTFLNCTRRTGGMGIVIDSCQGWR